MSLTAHQRETDPESPPPPEACIDCDAPLPWEWWAPPEQSTWSACWHRPACERCPSCESRHLDAELAKERDRRQHFAGIPQRYRGFTFRRTLRQQEGEAVDQFWARLGANTTSHLAVMTSGSQDGTQHYGCVRAMYDYHPKQGSMYLEGAPGSGKTLLACAKLNDLLSEPRVYQRVNDPLVHHPGHTRVRITGGYSVAMLGEDDLYESVRASNRPGLSGGVDEDVMGHASRVQILCIDDLGAVENMKEWHRDVMQRLVNLRYRDKRPMLVTSNKGLEQLVPKYGARTVSRLVEMVGDRRFSLPALGWRGAGQEPR